MLLFNLRLFLKTRDVFVVVATLIYSNRIYFIILFYRSLVSRLQPRWQELGVTQNDTTPCESPFFMQCMASIGLYSRRVEQSSRFLPSTTKSFLIFIIKNQRFSTTVGYKEKQNKRRGGRLDLATQPSKGFQQIPFFDRSATFQI